MMSARVNGVFRVELGVDVGENEIAIVVGDLGVGTVDQRVGGADAGSRSHGNDEEQPTVGGEQRQHPLVRGELIDDQVHALGEDVVVLGLLPRQRVVGVDERSGGVDQRLRADLERAAGDHIAGLRHPGPVDALRAFGGDIIGGDAAVVQRRADELEDEPGIVVMQVGVGILEAADRPVDVEDALFAAHRLR